jgi:hypothetical protein
MAVWLTGMACVRMIIAAAVFAGVLGVFADESLAAQEQRFPDVVAVRVQPRGASTFDFDVTVSSPYDTPRRHADAFRVVGKDGTIYGERKLWHDHAGEQPFTRDLYGVTIPTDIKTVVIQARDRKYGYGGKTIEVALPGR